jgi:uridine phosphorylase
MSGISTSHLRPTAPIATDVLLPGDPGRALSLAQDLLAQPRMANHHRGLWGYTGETADQALLTIQSTGLGGPSATIVLEELSLLGARRAVRIGTCRSVDPKLERGSLVIVDEAVSADGTSRELDQGPRLRPDPELTDALAEAAGDSACRATVASTDLYYRPITNAQAPAWLRSGARAVDLASAALLALGAQRGIAVAALLVVTEAGDRDEWLPDAELERSSLLLGRVAAGALASTAAEADDQSPSPSGTAAGS